MKSFSHEALKFFFRKSCFFYILDLAKTVWALRNLSQKVTGNFVINELWHCMKIRIFVFRRFVKRTEKIIFSLVFICFTEISYFLKFPSNGNVRKQHLSANAYSCVNMKFSYTIAVRKDEIFYVVLLRKQAIFHLRLGQLFVDDI